MAQCLERKKLCCPLISCQRCSCESLRKVRGEILMSIMKRTLPWVTLLWGSVKQWRCSVVQLIWLRPLKCSAYLWSFQNGTSSCFNSCCFTSGVLDVWHCPVVCLLCLNAKWLNILYGHNWRRTEPGPVMASFIWNQFVQPVKVDLQREKDQDVWSVQHSSHMSPCLYVC